MFQYKNIQAAVFAGCQSLTKKKNTQQLYYEKNKKNSCFSKKNYHY